MKFFEFSGFGNFSFNFGWDTGLSSGIDNELSAEIADKYDLECGVNVIHSNSHGGSRSLWGIVVAPSKEDAIELLKEFDSSFEVVEYSE